MKRERRPPKGWRKNMLTGAGFLILLDAIILGPGFTFAREAIAAGLTIFVGGFIVWVWITNTKIEEKQTQTS